MVSPYHPQFSRANYDMRSRFQLCRNDLLEFPRANETKKGEIKHSD